MEEGVAAPELGVVAHAPPGHQVGPDHDVDRQALGGGEQAAVGGQGERLPQISVPTLVLAGGRDTISRPSLCRAVADLIPGAGFEVMEEEAHQPFQEVPDEWNARVDAFWRDL